MGNNTTLESDHLLLDSAAKVQDATEKMLKTYAELVDSASEVMKAQNELITFWQKAWYEKMTPDDVAAALDKRDA